MLYLAARTHNHAAAYLHATRIDTLQYVYTRPILQLFAAVRTDGLPTEILFLPQNVKPRYTDIGHALVTETKWGNIDPHIFHDGADTYALWKRDGNAVNRPTPIFIQQLSPDGRSLLGQPLVTITDDLPWEGGLVEAPWVVKHAASYYLFYSSNNYNSDRYSISAAVAPSLKGPWQKAGKPLLQSAAPPHG